MVPAKAKLETVYDFCTYFDHRYLPRGLALYQSLAEHCRSFRLWVLCLDELCYQAIAQLDRPDFVPIALEEFEKGDPGLQKAKQNRTLLEYYFTCSPSLPLYILKNRPELGMITYIDSDLFLFGDPTPIFQEMGDRSIAITEHRYAPYIRTLPADKSPIKLHGLYNVGWLSFRNDRNGLDCLHWWRDQCLEWCYCREEDGRYCDQKYLDEWPTRFPGVAVLRHKGVNVGPWNLGGSYVGTRGKKVLVDGDPLLVFHFHGLREAWKHVYDVNSNYYQFKLTTTIRTKIYGPYLRTLIAMQRESARLVRTSHSLGGLKDNRKVSRPINPLSVFGSGRRKVEDIIDLAYSVYHRHCVAVIHGRSL